MSVLDIGGDGKASRAPRDRSDPVRMLGKLSQAMPWLWGWGESFTSFPPPLGKT